MLSRERECVCVCVYCSALQCVAVRRSALQCVALRCSALQCVAVCCSDERALIHSIARYNEWERVILIRLEIPSHTNICMQFFECVILFVRTGAFVLLSVLQHGRGALQCVAVRHSALQCVAVYCSVLQWVAVGCSGLQCVAVYCSVLCCNVLQCGCVCDLDGSNILFAHTSKIILLM